LETVGSGGVSSFVPHSDTKISSIWLCVSVSDFLLGNSVSVSCISYHLLLKRASDMDSFYECEERKLAPVGLQISLVYYSPGIAVFSVSEPCSTVIVAHVRLCFECSRYVLYGRTISQTSVSTTTEVLSW